MVKEVPVVAGGLSLHWIRIQCFNRGLTFTWPPPRLCNSTALRIAGSLGESPRRSRSYPPPIENCLKLALLCLPVAFNFPDRIEKVRRNGWMMRSWTIVVFLLSFASLRYVAGAKGKNILYIVVDDLRPQLGAYGQGYMHTPNIDALANRSLIFDRAYCQFSFCAPSRNSFMTGRRPDRTQCWNFIDNFREVGPNWISMPQYFKENGYFSTGVGKLYHPNLPPNGDPPSWSDFDKFPYINPSPRGCPNHTAWCSIDPQKYNFSDIETLNLALERLEYAAQNKSRPFFLGVGFHKPHLPFRSPTEFIGNYPPAEDIPIATNKEFPKNAPTIAWNSCLAVSQRYKDVTQTRDYLHPMEDDEAQRLRRGYYAAVSFTDSLVGKLLGRLKDLGLDNDTIVSFHADHGWQLGEVNINVAL